LKPRAAESEQRMGKLPEREKSRAEKRMGKLSEREKSRRAKSEQRI